MPEQPSVGDPEDPFVLASTAGDSRLPPSGERRAAPAPLRRIGYGLLILLGCSALPVYLLLGGPGGQLAVPLVTVVLAGIALARLALATQHHGGLDVMLACLAIAGSALTGPGWPPGPALLLLTAFLALIVAAARTVRGSAPRWSPARLRPAVVSALGSGAITLACLELTVRAAPPQSPPWPLLAASGGAVLLVVLTTALRVSTGSLRATAWLAAAAVLLTAATMAAAATGRTPLQVPVSDPLAAAALAGTLGALALLALPARRLRQRRRPQAPRQPIVAALTLSSGGLIAVSLATHTLRLSATVALLALLGEVFPRRLRPRAGGEARAGTDELTGLATRRALAQTLTDDTESGDPLAPSSAEISVLLIDLDRFADVNVALGHEAGDHLLTEVGGRLRTALRADQLLARVGGDEFAVLLPGAGEQTALRVAHTVQTTLRAPFAVAGTRVHLSASVGVAWCRGDRADRADLVRRADVAVHRAKSRGRLIQVYDESIDRHAGEQLRRIDELREALSRGEVVVHLQPQIDLRTGSICGAEALARWRHPHDGVLLPATFLPLAEQTGLMGPMAQHLLARALAATALWWPAHRIPVSVNLTATDLAEPALRGQVQDLLAAYQLPSSALRLELTEEVLMTDPVATARRLAELRADGVQICLDDFGTGYSALSYLRDLPVDEVKLDRSFVGDLHRPATTAIVRHTVAMAHDLHARTVGEGVEDEATARALVALGCDVGQGLYFAAALTPEEFLARLNAPERRAEQRPHSPVWSGRFIARSGDLS